MIKTSGKTNHKLGGFQSQIHVYHLKEKYITKCGYDENCIF